MRFFLASLGLIVSVSTTAAAQNGAVWLDDVGRMMTMQFAGGSGTPPDPIDRSPQQMVELFKALCVDTNGDPARIDLAAKAPNASLEAEPFTIAGTKKAPPLVLGIWRGQGIVLSRTDGFFAAPDAQCNTVFYVNVIPDRQSLTDALASSLGSAPTNVAKAMKKNGKPNNGYVPEWSVLSGTGTKQVIAAYVSKGSPYAPGNRVQIAIRAPKKVN